MSKKVKGIKLDLFEFNGPNGYDDLPTAPDPNRDPNDKRRGGGGRGGDRGGGGYGGRGGGDDRGFGSRQNSFGRGGEEETNSWSRSSGSGFNRTNSSGGFGSSGGRNDFGGGGGRDNFGNSGGGFGRTNSGSNFGGRNSSDSWGGNGSSRGGGGGGGADSWAPSNSSSEKSERPKLNLQPRSVPLPEDNNKSTTEETTNTDNNKGKTGPEVDKYAEAFRKAKEDREAKERERAEAAMPSLTSPQLKTQSRWKVEEPVEKQTAFGFDNNSSRYSNDARNQFSNDSRNAAPAFAPRELSKTEIEARNALAAKEAAKAEKAKKREEEERLAREAKEAKQKAEKDALEALKAADENAKVAAQDAIASGLLGEKLYDHIKNMEKKPTGASLIFKVLSIQSDVSSLAWCTSAQYGFAIKSLLEGKIKDQVAAIYAIQECCHSKKFPKIDVKGTKRNLIEVIFQLVYKNDIIEHEAFSKWSDDDNITNIPGKQDAAFQTVNFFTVINEPSEDEYDEDEEEEEIDAPREVVK